MISILTEKKIAWSTLVQYAGKIVQLVIGVIAVKTVTNYLGPEEYGNYAKISETALFFATAGNLGIFGNTVRALSGVSRESSSANNQSSNIFYNALFVRIATAIPILLIPIIFYPKLGLLFFATSLFFEYITSVCDAALQANYMMGRATAALVIGRIFNLSVILLLAKFGVEPIADLFFLAPLISTLITAILSLYFVRKKIPFTFKLNKILQKELLFSSIPFGIINIINNLYFRFLPSFFAAKILLNGAYATYNVSLHIAAYAGLISTFLMFSVLPELEKNIKEENRLRAKELFLLCRKILILLGIVMVIAGSYLSPYAIELLTGKEYFNSELAFLLPCMLVLAAISYFYDLVLITLFAFKLENWFLKRELIALAIATIFFIIGWQTESILTIILGAIAGETFMVLTGMKKVYKSI